MSAGCAKTAWLLVFTLQSDLHTPIAIFDLCVNIFFLVDVALNFKTAYAGGYKQWVGREG